MVSKLHLMLLVLVCVVRSAFSDGCPKADVISPCSCEESDGALLVFCHNEDMKLEEVKKVLTAFDKQYTLDLLVYYVNLGTVPTDFFKGFNIRRLNFALCTLEQIPDEKGRVLVGLEDSLEELTVIGTINKQNSPVVLDVSHLKKITDLHLSQNTIPELSDNWFKKGPTSLTGLYITGNWIEKLGSNAFANLPNLKALWLIGNRYGEMKRSMLPNPATHLEDLRLGVNDFHGIPEDFFTEMPALTSLSLEDNKFKVLPEVTFQKIWAQLDRLNLHRNPLNCEDSALEWMVKASHKPSIIGVCAEPPERKGDNIMDVIKGNQ